MQRKRHEHDVRGKTMGCVSGKWTIQSRRSQLHAEKHSGKSVCSGGRAQDSEGEEPAFNLVSNGDYERFSKALGLF